MLNLITPKTSVLTQTVFCLQCESTTCTHEKVIFTTSMRCEGELIYRVGIHADQKQN